MSNPKSFFFKLLPVLIALGLPVDGGAGAANISKALFRSSTGAKAEGCSLKGSSASIVRENTKSTSLAQVSSRLPA